MKASQKKIVSKYLNKLGIANNRSLKRIPRLCSLLEKVWLVHPEMRLGQLIYFLVALNLRQDFYRTNLDRTEQTNIFYIEDDYLLKSLNRYLLKRKLHE